MNLEKKRAEERASKQSAGTKGVSKQTARAAKASAAIFALLSLATFFTSPLSNFGYTGSEVVLYTTNNHLDSARGGGVEEDLTFSTGRVLLALDDGLDLRGGLPPSKDRIDAFFPKDPNEARIWNKTCVEQIEVRKLFWPLFFFPSLLSLLTVSAPALVEAQVIDMAVTKEQLKSFPRLHVNRTAAESDSPDHSEPLEDKWARPDAAMGDMELSDEETFKQMEALSNVALVAVGEGLEENWKQASWESEGILTTMECVEVFEFQQVSATDRQRARARAPV